MIASHTQSRIASRGRRAAFSLIEIVIAMAIIATGMIAIVGLIPVGLEASRDASVRTVTAIILEDIHDRLEGQILDQDSLPPEDQVASIPFYYDDQGIYITVPGEDTIAETEAAASAGVEEAIDAMKDINSQFFKRRYRVDVRIVDILDTNKPQPFAARAGNAFALNKGVSPYFDVERVKAIIIDLSWPVNPATGEAMGDRNPKSSVTYYLTTLTGIEWESIDPLYEPKIEF